MILLLGPYNFLFAGNPLASTYVEGLRVQSSKGNLMKKTFLALLIGMGAISGAVACADNDGPAEEAGEEIDEAADEVEDSVD